MGRLIPRFQRRYVSFLWNFLIKEKIRGLDFTMIEMGLSESTGGKFSNYCITPEKHLEDIFSKLDINENDSFIDIGCGKGLVLKFASQYPFKRIVGVDIQKKLIDRAETNMKRLGLADKIELVCDDAINFSEYDQFTYYYFFQPFNKEVFEPVVDTIIKTLATNPRKITVVYYEPLCYEIFENAGYFKLRTKLYDPQKGYSTYIYDSISI